jgi:predicted DNA-binding protein
MDADFAKVSVEETSKIEIIEHTEEELAEIARLEAISRNGGRTGAFYQQEFPEHVTRPLTDLERFASAQRGFIRKDRKRKRYENK